MNDLAYLIGQESSALEILIATLLEEQAALKAGHADALQAIVEKKNRTLESLARHGRRRNELLQKAGLPADVPGIRAWANGNRQQDLVFAFLAMADEARELNRLNGQLISLRLQSTQAALETLAPKNPSQGLYGRSGTTSFSTGYRLIDSA